MSDYTSRSGWPQSWGTTGQAFQSLSKAWGEDIPTVFMGVTGKAEKDREAFEWCIEQFGHYEIHDSYGVTRSTRWVGPLFSPENKCNNVFVFKDVQDAALFRMFFG